MLPILLRPLVRDDRQTPGRAFLVLPQPDTLSLQSSVYHLFHTHLLNACYLWGSMLEVKYEHISQ